MEQTISIFKGCEAFAESLAEKQVSIEKLQQEILSERVESYSHIEKVSEKLFSIDERTFLNLKTTSGNTVLRFIVDKISAGPSVTHKHKDQTRLMLNDFLLIEITSNEINEKGFAYDSGRRKLEGIVQSIMNKFDIPLAYTEFDYQEKYVFAIQTTAAEFDY